MELLFWLLSGLMWLIIGVVIVYINFFIEINSDKKYKSLRKQSRKTKKNYEKNHDANTPLTHSTEEKTDPFKPLIPVKKEPPPPIPAPEFENFHYESKNYMTASEIEVFEVLQELKSYNLQVFPQIPLSSVVRNIDYRRKYVNELFRTIDYGVFDPNFKCLLLIELNDYTHNAYDRQLRDKKVAYICYKAQIPLLTFPTKNYHKREITDKVIEKLNQGGYYVN
ncbi:MAG: DUF2726 domain-containing protein [Oscillospiraceae bacterium]|nr:DUF2726 domain-containing protein [Oscillospiraceae bacterium]